MRGRNFAWSGTGLLILAVAWVGLAENYHELIVPAPGTTWESLLALSRSGQLWAQLAITLERLLLGLLIGSLCGLILGVLAGLTTEIKLLMKPFIAMIFSVPPVVLVVLAMLWFGMGSDQIVFVISVLVFPTVYINCVEGMETIDDRLVEMAEIYNANPLINWFDIYLPALASSILSGFSLAAGMAIRITVMAELLGSSNGIGYAISRARTNLDTPQLFAWILVCIGLVASVELLFVKPVRNYLLHWKQNEGGIPNHQNQ